MDDRRIDYMKKKLIHFNMKFYQVFRKNKEKNIIQEFTRKKSQNCFVGSLYDFPYNCNTFLLKLRMINYGLIS